ncbi:MAG: YgjV family protein [Oscillospiraceae bacterium]|nr:YgjV family protein [Oscillospiraceae bacterium]MBQ6902056.1 YgjV family protein [Oscillospiraceae bacterium]
MSYVLSVLGLISMICASLTKGEKMKRILFFVFCGNFLVATSYLVAGSGINGAAACYIGSIMSIVTYFFDSKNKPLPLWVIAINIASVIAVNIWASGLSPLGILIIIASLTFVMCIGQKNGAKYRFWTIVNMLLWCTYDVLSKSYAALFTHVSLLVFTVIGMLIHDRKKGN